MLQYTPKNWPYDNAHLSTQENKTSPPKAVYFLIVIKKQDVARQPIGCFKARQMASFMEMRMKGHA